MVIAETLEPANSIISDVAAEFDFLASSRCRMICSRSTVLLLASKIMPMAAPSRKNVSVPTIATSEIAASPNSFATTVCLRPS